MKLHFSRAATALLAVSTSFLLMACGSGNNATVVGGSSNVGTTDLPVAATQDSGSAFSFIAMVVAKGDADADNPLVLSDAANDPLLATSETADPQPIAI